MSVTIGAQLGSYEVIGLLGKGGMGEVYRARDAKLKRDVAIKILPNEFSHDPQRLSRFQREAEVLASLNHPNIAAIYDLQESNDTRFLVLELVEGETLAERIQRGPIPVEEALQISKHICDALEAAHVKGIVHRDLKPANVKITPDGRVKVLDFGLAKAMETTPASGTLSNSPTLTLGATRAGVIVGTAAYMSPEQAKSFDVDVRSDTFSFGSVLFEMLTGRTAFQGDTVADVLASVLAREPDFSLLPSNLNPRLRELLERCLKKNPKQRWQAVGDLRADLELASAMPYAVPAPRYGAPSAWSGHVLWLYSSVFLLLLLAGAGVAFLSFYRSLNEAPIIQFFVNPPEKGSFSSGTGAETTNVSVSPDGRRLAFTARDSSSKVLLWVRSFDTLTSQPLAGTDGAFLQFWSPDSRSIGFFAQGKLKRIDINGGPPQTLANAPNGRGGTWNRDDVIIFAPASNAGLFRVGSQGGEPVAMTKLAAGQSSHRGPSFLPDGRHFLYAVGERSGQVSGIFVGAVGSDESKRLISANSKAEYSASGYLLFVQRGTLLRQPFDAKKLELSGDSVPIAEHVSSYNGIGAFSVSDNGVLAYRTLEGTEDVELTWVDRSGNLLERVGMPGAYRGVDVSRDGRIAVHRHDGEGGDIWIVESSQGPMTRETFDASRENSSPIWSPDGTRIAFGALRDSKWTIYQKLANGSGAEDPLFESDLNSAPMAWSPDGKFMVLRVVATGITQATNGCFRWTTKKQLRSFTTRPTSCALRFRLMENGSRMTPTRPDDQKSTSNLFHPVKVSARYPSTGAFRRGGEETAENSST